MKIKVYALMIQYVNFLPFQDPFPELESLIVASLKRATGPKLTKDLLHHHLHI